MISSACISGWCNDPMNNASGHPQRLKLVCHVPFSFKTSWLLYACLLPARLEIHLTSAEPNPPMWDLQRWCSCSEELPPVISSFTIWRLGGWRPTCLHSVLLAVYLCSLGCITWLLDFSLTACASHPCWHFGSKVSDQSVKKVIYEGL